MKKMTNIEFVNILKDIESQFKTSYMLGCFGWPANDGMIKRAVSRKDVNNLKYKQGAESIKNEGFMFDCVCLIKSILWGWTGDFSKTYGGAVYASNGVNDIGADQMIKECYNVSTDFNNIKIGCAVWLPGHIGVYIGDGQVIECTPKWCVSPGVKKTYLKNLGFDGSMSRSWTKWGFLPYLQYIDEVEKTENENVEIPTYAKDAIQFFVDNHYLKGNGEVNYGLSIDMIRILCIFYRMFKDKGMI